MPRISSENRITLPVEALEIAGLKPGDEVTVQADGPDSIVIHRIVPDAGLGVFDGLYEADYLDDLRAGERG